MQLRPDNPNPHFNLGNLFLVRKEYDNAEDAFRRYSALWPSSGRGAGRLGLLHLLRGRYAEAIPLLDRARGVQARSGVGPSPPASSLLRTAISLVEDDPGALTLLGQSLIEQGKPEEAIDALGRAAALAPGATAAHFSLVQAYRQSGHDDLARDELSVLRRLDPAAWITNPSDCWDAAEALDRSRHYWLTTDAQARRLRPADAMELRIDKILEYAK